MFRRKEVPLNLEAIPEGVPQQPLEFLEESKNSEKHKLELSSDAEIWQFPRPEDRIVLYVHNKFDGGIDAWDKRFTPRQQRAIYSVVKSLTDVENDASLTSVYVKDGEDDPGKTYKEFNPASGRPNRKLVRESHVTAAVGYLAAVGITNGQITDMLGHGVFGKVAQEYQVSNKAGESKISRVVRVGNDDGKQATISYEAEKRDVLADSTSGEGYGKAA